MSHRPRGPLAAVGPAAGTSAGAAFGWSPAPPGRDGRNKMINVRVTIRMPKPLKILPDILSNIVSSEPMQRFIHHGGKFGGFPHSPMRGPNRSFGVNIALLMAEEEEKNRIQIKSEAIFPKSLRLFLWHPCVEIPALISNPWIPWGQSIDSRS